MPKESIDQLSYNTEQTDATRLFEDVLQAAADGLAAEKHLIGIVEAIETERRPRISPREYV